MKTKHIFVIILCIALMLSLSSCVEEESEETLASPEFDTMMEYRISDTEYIRLLYSNEYSGFGEWVKDGEIKKLFYDCEYKYWGILFSRMGVTEQIITIYEIEDLALASTPEEDGYSYRYVSGGDKLIARLDEGLLNSTKVIMYGSNGELTDETLEISEINRIENYEGFFDWVTPEWEAFCASSEDAYYEIKELSLQFSSVTGQGEWITNGVAVPVRIEFDSLACNVRVFDISGEKEARILFGNGYMEEGDFVVDDFTSSMVYGDTVTELHITKKSITVDAQE